MYYIVLVFIETLLSINYALFHASVRVITTLELKLERSYIRRQKVKWIQQQNGKKLPVVSLQMFSYIYAE